MTFTPSTSPDITEGLPFVLSAASATEGFISEGVHFDVYLGGIGFRLAPTDTRRYRRQTARSQKDQFDNSREAGEQTFSQYWLRSQTSWHHGAGIVNYEPGSDDTTQYRFAESVGLDPWTLGDLKLLRRTVKVADTPTAAIVPVTGAVVGGADVVFTNEGSGAVRRRDATGAVAATYTGVTGISRVAHAGSKILVGTASTIAIGDASGSTLADLYTGAAAAPVPYWVKGRIIASAANKLFELVLDGSSTGFGGTPLFTHPDPGWRWSAVCESPGSIFAAGHSNGLSAIYRFDLVSGGTSGGLPVLSQGFQVTELPPGEEITALHVYLGKFVGIGTTKGLRVGELSNASALTAAGVIQYGPRVVERPITAITASDRFLYAAATQPDGNSGAVRVDLSAEIGQNTLRFAYAWDARTDTGAPVSGIAMMGNSDRVVMGAASSGVYLQSATELEESGWFNSGLVRYTTVEPKVFRAIDVTSAIPGGTIVMESLDFRGDGHYLGTMTVDTTEARGIRIGYPRGSFESMAFRFTLHRDSADPTVGPTLQSYQIKAVPAPKRQRMFSIPVLCFDSEEDRQGTPYGYEGFGLKRLLALEELEEFNAVAMFRDVMTNERFEALVEQITFENSTPSDPNDSRQGYVELLLRKL